MEYIDKDIYFRNIYLFINRIKQFLFIKEFNII